MFKKLKQKISEEQSPVRSSLSPQQQGLSRGTPTGNRSRSSSATEQQDDSTTTPDKELLAGMIAEPALLSEYTIFALDHTKRSKPQSDSVNESRSADNMNGNDPASTQKSEAQSFAQKLQLRVPSMESLFRSPVKESLFRSPSKESLVRSGSRESLNRIDAESPGPIFDPSSDIESEAEDSVVTVEGLNKEQLFHRLRRMEKSLGNYRGKYSELVTAYRTTQRDKEKLQSILSQSQDKALRRIGELREELQMDQQAKKHLQEEFDASLEEKDQLISVLQTQVTLLKQRLGKGHDDTEISKPKSSSDLNVQTAVQEADADNSSTPGADGSGDNAKTSEDLQVRVKRQENLLLRCKETIRLHKERSAQLTSEKEALQNQLDERLQELEKIKELHTSEKTKLITQLRDAKNLVEQLEQDKGMVIAETKRQMHETLEMKEEEVSQLRSRVKQLSKHCEELQEQKEKSEKAAFEELEKALGATQKTEEARLKGLMQMEEQMKAVEQAGEEERMNLQKELSRVKQEVVDIMKKSCDDRITELEKSHAEAILGKEREQEARIRILEEELKEQLKTTLANQQDDHIKAMQEKDQQGLLALEELELQKKAIQSQTENQLQEMQQEVEDCRTRILELESLLAKSSQDSDSKSEELAVRIESETNKHNAEINAIIEKHKQDIDRLDQEKEKIWTEKFDLLKEQHKANINELKEKDQQEWDAQLKEKERLFQVHIQEMNEKTLEKLDVKQTELEALSAELSEAVKSRQEIEQKLIVSEHEIDKIKLQYEKQLGDERQQYEKQLAIIEKEKEVLTQGVEKGLKEEINHLKMLLDGKEKEIEELRTENQKLMDSTKKAEADFKEVTTRLDETLQSHHKKSQEEAEAYAVQLTILQEELNCTKKDRDHLKELADTAGSQLKNVYSELGSYKDQVESLSLEMEEQRKSMTDQLNTLQLQADARIKEFQTKIEELAKIALERENETIKVKETHEQHVLDIKQNMSSTEKKLLSLQEEYQTKFKHQEAKIEKMKQRIKDVQDSSKKKYIEMENKLKKELEKKQLEINNKEKQFNEKMLEMAHASSVGINDAMSQLEVNHKEQMQSVKETHQRELEETIQTWEKKVHQHVEELKEKNELELQEKDQAVMEVKQQLASMAREKEDAEKQILELKEAKVTFDVSFQEIQNQLGQASAQVLALMQNESNLKTQLEMTEKECLNLKNDKIVLEEKLGGLIVSLEEEKTKTVELAEKLHFAEDHCQQIDCLLNKERTDFERELQVKLSEKEVQCNHLLAEQEKKLDSYCKEAIGLLELITSGLTEKYNSQMNRLMSRIAHCESKVIKLIGVISKHQSKINNLQIELEHIAKQNDSIQKSLHQATVQLQEKENVVLSIKDELHTLLLEKDALQKEGGSHQKAADEKESCITQLKKELSENINKVTSLTETLREKESEAVSLHTLINELKLKLENSIDLEEKENAIAFVNTQHKDSQVKLENQIQDLMSKIEALNQEKAASLEEAGKWKNRLEEWKKKAELKFTQNHNTIKELKEQIEKSNKENKAKDEDLQKITEEFALHRKNTEQNQVTSESKESKLTSELESQKTRNLELDDQMTKLMSENKCLLEELERQNLQKNTEKKEFIEKLDHIQSVVTEKNNYCMEAQQKVLELEKEISALKQDFTEKEMAWEQAKIELSLTKDKELKALEDRLALESSNKLAELKKKAEQKIASVKKQLMSQLEEKEQSIRDAESQLNAMKEKMQNKEHIVQEGLLQGKKELENRYSLLESQHRDKETELASINGELALKQQKITELEDRLDILQKTLHENEELVREKELTLANEKEAWKNENEGLSSKYEKKLLGLQEELAIKDTEIKMYKENAEETERAHKELKVLLDESESQENTLRQKLVEAEGDIQKYRKEVAKLQKDMRALRKEHNQELDLLKKELTEEAEQRIKHEQEDMELKHNSTLKQLMREFNTQMAQKERELETSVQETIAKAQEVEAELMQTQHIEATQLHKKIAEKEEDLKRTVKKYEDILEAREEEMTAKVTELQEQLEKLQDELSRKQEEKEAQDEEDQVSEFQVQLAQKTSQLNQAKLNEQELKEKISALEDQLKSRSQGVFVTPLGTPYKDVNHRYTDVSVFGEPTEFEYLRKVMFEYMMGRETKTLAKVITTVLRFPPDQAQKILEREDSRTVSWLRPAS